MANFNKSILATWLLVLGAGVTHTPAMANTGTAFAAGVSLGNVQNTSLKEISGCVAGRVNPNAFWVHNDSGDSARVFALDRTGKHLGVFNLSGASARDYEDIAMGPGPVAGKNYLYVGDIGDNGRSRSDVQVYRLAEPAIGSASTTQGVEKIVLRYPDGANNAETLMVDPWNGDLYIATKDTSGKLFRFKAPFKSGQTYTGERVGTLGIEGLTGGDIAVDGRRILMSTNQAQTGSPRFFLWLRNAGESVASALARKPVQLSAVSGQLEAVCWDNAGVDFHAVTEGSSRPFYYFKSLDSNGSGTNPDTDTGAGSDSGQGDTLASGKELGTGQSLHATNGNYRLTLQSDGNLVLYTKAGKALWSTKTNGKGATRFILQGDGNLVLRNAAGTSVWASGTQGKGGVKLVLQNDGNLVLLNSSGKTLWATNTGDGTTAGGGGGGGDTGGGSSTGGVKIAFIGDTGYGSNFQKVLNLIKSEKAELTIVAGDTSYSRNGDDDWDAMVRNTLGGNDPAIVVAGNHDYEDSRFTDVRSFGQNRLNRQSAVKCSGAYAEKMTCSYKNIFFVLSAIGSSGSRSDHESFIRNSLNNAPRGAWRVCGWHKNQRDMQVGSKSDEVGWTAYETCREKGAIIATGHEHSYERTHLLSDMSDKTVSSTSSSFTVSEGKTFAFVSGLGGIGIRDQERGGAWWAKIYTSTQGATYGAMFGTFYPDRAEFYFKNINGKIIDQFTVKKGY